MSSEPYYSDDKVTLYQGDCLDVLRQIPDESVDAVVTDPPYGLGSATPEQVAETVRRWTDGERDFLPATGGGFMGKRWDSFVPPVAVWDECRRVLKPGGHLLAFAGSRTVDLMTLGVRLADFEVRDGIMWLYGSGFPKSRNVDDAMRRWLAGEAPVGAPRSNVPADVYCITRFIRDARDAAGWTNRQIDALFGTNGMAGHWTSQASQPAVPSLRQWGILKAALGFGDDLNDLVASLAATERPDDAIGRADGRDARFLGTLRKSEDYESVSGWGTALKPAYEPVVMARKPFRGSTTANVLTHGTGALNIDACRVPSSPEDQAKFARGAAAWREHAERHGATRADGSTAKASNVFGVYGSEPSEPHELGRWPTNVLLDESQAAALDQQSNDGGASRYFPTFRYEAKAPTIERPRSEDGTAHPTVKPLDLMRWLVRLVTPPGGTVLEPFAGSGTTAEACVIEGFRCIAIEREDDYLPLIVARLTKPIQPDMFGGVVA